jgi:hypothetical protein
MQQRVTLQRRPENTGSGLLRERGSFSRPLEPIGAMLQVDHQPRLGLSDGLSHHYSNGYSGFPVTSVVLVAEGSRGRRKAPVFRPVITTPSEGIWK